MYKELVVNVTEQETRVALLENSNITEIFIERGDDSNNIAGNIYKGRIQRVLPGMQAAFVDIGLLQAAFLYVDDVIYKQNIDSYEPPELNDDNDENSPKKNIPIEKLLREGQELMVQVTKSPIGTKGARVTTYISIPGRYLVLMPTVDHIGISKRIDVEGERQRLKDIIVNARKINYGYIFRTAAEDIDSDQLEKEMELLVNSWENIKKRYKNFSSPYLLHKDLTITFRAIRDLLTHEAHKLVIDSLVGYDAVLRFLNKIMPELKVDVELYTQSEPIFEYYNIEGDISRALKRKVWLKSGGYIVIEQTEALTSIDVNTGRYVGNHNFEDTIFCTNLEAISEIAYQIRLRNIGGIIIIDFIDMETEAHREIIYQTLKEHFINDKSKTNILPMSEIGLIQMTRKRVKKSLTRMLCEPCPNCSGDGYILSKKTVSQKIYREINRYARDMIGNEFILKVNPEMMAYLTNNENSIMYNLETRVNKRINITGDEKYHIEEFEITEKIDEKNEKNAMNN